MASTKFHLSVLILLSYYLPVSAQTGHVVHGVGAVNQSMAGAGTALPLDATGALFWNPGSITDLESSELDINIDLGLIDAAVSSSLAPNALAPGLPPRTLSGSSQTDVRRAILGSIAWVQQPNKRKWTYGILVAEVGGFGFNFKKNSENPITTAPPPNGFGVGEIFTNYKLIQIAPTLAYEIDNHLSVGIAPNLDFSSLEVDPFPLASPDDANRDGFPTYPKSDRPWTVGGGLQGGLYYKSNGWHLGVSLKSPQWFESSKFDGLNELGQPRSFKFTLNYPMIITAGVGHSGSRKLKWAADARYIDYQNTKGFDKTGINPETGAVRGLGWRSIWVFATGLEVRLSDRFWLRSGYGLNGNPIRDRDTFFNLGAPLITQQQANIGFSYQSKRNLTVSFAYHHAFENKSRGPYQSPAGPLSGSAVQSEFGTGIFVLSLNLRSARY